MNEVADNRIYIYLSDVKIFVVKSMVLLSKNQIVVYAHSMVFCTLKRPEIIYNMFFVLWVQEVPS